jgi:L-threonylcarbamoyladenylate synthase
VSTPISPPSDGTISAAAQALRQGELVIFPTETVYGLGASAIDDRAVALIYAAKGRPQFNPLIVHVADTAAAQDLAHFNARALALAERFWPGPLTLVLPKRQSAGLSLLATAGLDTVALRVPHHPVALALLRAAGVPVVAPSANPSGRVSPTTAAHAAETLFSPVAMVLDGGPCKVGLESTIVGFDGERPVLLRPGGLSRAAIEAVAGPLASPAPHGKPSAPGQLASHYAPRARLRLNAAAPLPHEAFLAFGPDAPATFNPTGNPTLNLSPSGDLTEAAANLFAHLRALDASRAAVIAVMPIPDMGLGEAINDRLARAAAPRDIVTA